MANKDAPKPRPRPGFVLSKWYLDCVAEDGTAFIGYHAALAYRGARVHYASTLLRGAGGDILNAVSLRNTAPPSVEGSTVRWSHGALGVVGVWDALVPSIEETLLGTAGGTVRWRCEQPLAEATVRAGRGTTVSGLGYTERLELTVPPWRLPIEELRWGHFLAAEAALVWIDWRGTQPATWVFLNGSAVSGFEVGDACVAGPDAELTLGHSTVLREGPLTSTALAGVGAITRLIPARGLPASECKWLSRGELRRGGTGAAAGWAVNEVVRLGGGHPR